MKNNPLVKKNLNFFEIDLEQIMKFFKFPKLLVKDVSKINMSYFIVNYAVQSKIDY